MKKRKRKTKSRRGEQPKKRTAKVLSEKEKFELWLTKWFAGQYLALKDRAMIQKMGWFAFTARDVAANFSSMGDFVRAMIERNKKFKQVRTILEAMLRLADTSKTDTGKTPDFLDAFPDAHDAENFFTSLARCLAGDLARIYYDDIGVAKIIALEPFGELTKEVRERMKSETGLLEENFRQRKLRLKRLLKEQEARLFPPSVTKKV